jgi:hypothetical protein
VDAPTTRRGTLPASRTGVVAGLLALAVDVPYVVLVRSEDNGSGGRVVFVAAVIAAAGVAALIGSTRPGADARLPWLAVATGVLASLGFLALFSIGLPLMIAGVLAGIAWGSASQALDPGARRARAVAVAWAALGVALPWIGIVLT